MDSAQGTPMTGGLTTGAWDEQLPTELAARAAASAAANRYRPADPNAPMIGDAPDLATMDEGPTPIFDSISMWFNDSAIVDGKPTVKEEKNKQEIDLREERSATTSATSRWASLGDQRWLATNARAAAAPEVAGNTTAGLPRRRPGANLLPSAHQTAASPAAVAAAKLAVNAEVVRGRLGDYQRGLASARRSRQSSGVDASAGSLFTAARGGDTTTGHKLGEQGGDQ
jgi:hypothetical protein